MKTIIQIDKSQITSGTVIFILWMVIFLPSISYSQNYKTQYHFPEIIQSNQKIASDIDLSTHLLSIVGEYAPSLTSHDQLSSLPTESPDSLFRTKFKPVPARAYILQEAAKHRIVIFNEAHHQPLHRVFTASFLDTLWDMGFRYFGAEGLVEFPYYQEKYQYPVAGDGWYLDEPQYGNLVRKAMQLGYDVFGYDNHRIENFVNDSIHLELRDKFQAQKILKILQKDSTAKILIHCGYGHLIENKQDGRYKSMGVWIKELSGIDPLTIEQTRLTERGSPEYEDPYFHLAEDIGFSAAFIDTAGNGFMGATGEHLVDIRIYHPRTKFINGRPHWLLTENKTYVNLPDSLLSDCPCLVFAYYSDERVGRAIPTDVIYIPDSLHPKSLILDKDKDYEIVVRHKQGSIHTHTEVVSKYKFKGLEFFPSKD
jgi:hypothetical protein